MPNTFRRQRPLSGLSAAVFCSNHSILHHRIQPTLRERMAPQHTPSPHHSTPQHAIPLYRFHRVLRTRRHVAARRRKHWRNPPFVKSQQPERERLHFYFSLSISFFAITSRARPPSSSPPENSSVSTDFFGLITPSTAPALFSTERRSRTASRNRRLIRFRSTAPPSTRPTVNPTRAPFSGTEGSSTALFDNAPS